MMPKLTVGERATFTLVTCLSIKHPKIFQGALAFVFIRRLTQVVPLFLVFLTNR